MSTLSYLLLVAVIILENAGLPLPGEIAIVSVVDLLGERTSSLILLIVAAAGAAVVGDSIGYAAGRRMGEPLLTALESRIWPSSHGLAWVERIFSRFGLILIPLSRFFIGVRVFTAPLAGTARIPYPTFFLLDLIGALLWSATCVGIGVVGVSLATWWGSWAWVVLAMAGCLLLALIARSVTLPVSHAVRLEAVEIREGGGKQ